MRVIRRRLSTARDPSCSALIRRAVALGMPNIGPDRLQPPGNPVGAPAAAWTLARYGPAIKSPPGT